MYTSTFYLCVYLPMTSELRAQPTHSAACLDCLTCQKLADAIGTDDIMHLSRNCFPEEPKLHGSLFHPYDLYKCKLKLRNCRITLQEMLLQIFINNYVHRYITILIHMEKYISSKEMYVHFRISK